MTNALLPRLPNLAALPSHPVGNKRASLSIQQELVLCKAADRTTCSITKGVPAFRRSDSLLGSPIHARPPPAAAMFGATGSLLKQPRRISIVSFEPPPKDPLHFLLHTSAPYHEMRVPPQPETYQLEEEIPKEEQPSVPSPETKMNTTHKSLHPLLGIQREEPEDVPSKGLQVFKDRARLRNTNALIQSLQRKRGLLKPKPIEELAEARLEWKKKEKQKQLALFLKRQLAQAVMPSSHSVSSRSQTPKAPPSATEKSSMLQGSLFRPPQLTQTPRQARRKYQQSKMEASVSNYLPQIEEPHHGGGGLNSKVLPDSSVSVHFSSVDFAQKSRAAESSNDITRDLKGSAIESIANKATTVSTHSRTAFFKSRLGVRSPSDHTRDTRISALRRSSCQINNRLYSKFARRFDDLATEDNQTSQASVVHRRLFLTDLMERDTSRLEVREFMESLLSDWETCSYVASKEQFKKLKGLLSRNFGYDERKQVNRENKIKKRRLQVTKDKKFMVELEGEEVDLSRFEELEEFIREEELKRLARQDMGVRTCEDDHAYNQRRMNLYKKFFFQLIRKTDDELINQRYERHRQAKPKPKTMDFFERMKRDQEKRKRLKKIMEKVTASPPPQSRRSSPRKYSDKSLSRRGSMKRYPPPGSPGRRASWLRRTKHEDQIDRKLRDLEHRLQRVELSLELETED